MLSGRRRHIFKFFLTVFYLSHSQLSDGAVLATPRMLESLIRLAEAFAKMELRDIVTVEDVREAYDLLNEATFKVREEARICEVWGREGREEVGGGGEVCGGGAGGERGEVAGREEVGREEGGGEGRGGIGRGLGQECPREDRHAVLLVRISIFSYFYRSVCRTADTSKLGPASSGRARTTPRPTTRHINLQQSAVDPVTGKIDMNALRTGVSVRDRQLMDLAQKLLAEIVGQQTQSVKEAQKAVNELLTEKKMSMLNGKKWKQVVESAVREGQVILRGDIIAVP